jgi:2-polyprenyl-3-methyl-5-hydroxy-6-metoxy-1,4-benzoquinol methylase
MLDLLKQLLKNSRLVQHAYNWVQDKNIVSIDKRCLDYVATMKMDTGDKYLPSKDLISVLQVRGDYRFDDIREDDIVIDIGANIGAFSIPASRVSKHVYAVEPITVEELKEEHRAQWKEDNSPRSCAWRWAAE